MTSTLQHIVRRGLPILLLLLIASPLWAYVVVLKDGTKIAAKEKYRIDGEKVIVTLPSGAETFFPRKDLDVAATEKANAGGKGLAKTLVDENDQRIQSKAPPPKHDPTLEDILTQRGGGLSLPDAKRRDPQEIADQAPLTAAGFVDLARMPRHPYQDADITSEVLRYLQAQGVEGARIYQGTSLDRPFVEVVASTEATVFKVLKDAANALVQAHDRYPDRIAAMQLLMTTRAQVRAGQFELTVEQASALVTDQIDPPAFFYRYVQF